MKINQRLKQIGDWVEPNSKVLDVGCDHALLDIYLVEKKIGIQAIAADIKEGPLKQAKKNIVDRGLDNQITIKLGDGLDPIEEDVNCVVISGMGGMTMKHILQKGKNYFPQLDTIIVSPNNDLAPLRAYLVQNGFYIEEEQLIKEHRIYPILKFKKGKKNYSKKEILFGPVFLKNKNDLVLKYYQEQQTKQETILKRLPKKYWWKRYQVKKRIQLLKKTFS